MPTDEDLDKMAMKIAGVLFNQLAHPDHKAKVMQLALLADISADVRDIARWYEKSKLWEGEAYVWSNGNA